MSLATAIVVVVAIVWPLVRDELDRAPPASPMEPLSLAPTAAIGGAPFPAFSTDTVDISGVGPASPAVDPAAGGRYAVGHPVRALRLPRSSGSPKGSLRLVQRRR